MHAIFQFKKYMCVIACNLSRALKFYSENFIHCTNMTNFCLITYSQINHQSCKSDALVRPLVIHVVTYVMLTCSDVERTANVIATTKVSCLTIDRE